MKKALKIFFIFLAAVAAIYVVLVVIRMFHFYNLDKTNEQVAKIHNTKLTMDDVTGKNLPQDPGAEADKTIAGIDANKNGIRDDVELAIFKQYPDSAKTRAVLLQYALALQMEATLPIVNPKTVTAWVEDIHSKADSCVGNLTSRVELDKFLDETKNKPEFSDERNRRLNEYVEKIERNINFVEKKQFNTEERKQYDKDFYKYLRSYSASHEECDIYLLTLPN